jgi:hypothetical protein
MDEKAGFTVNFQITGVSDKSYIPYTQTMHVNQKQAFHAIKSMQSIFQGLLDEMITVSVKKTEAKKEEV